MNLSDTIYYFRMLSSIPRSRLEHEIVLFIVKHSFTILEPYRRIPAILRHVTQLDCIRAMQNFTPATSNANAGEKIIYTCMKLLYLH